MSEAVLETSELKRSFTQGDVTIEVLRGIRQPRAHAEPPQAESGRQPVGVMK